MAGGGDSAAGADSAAGPRPAARCGRTSYKRLTLQSGGSPFINCQSSSISKRSRETAIGTEGADCELSSPAIDILDHAVANIIERQTPASTPPRWTAEPRLCMNTFQK